MKFENDKEAIYAIEMERKECEAKGKKMPVYSEALKKAIVEYHYHIGVNPYTLSNRLGLGINSVSQWKRKYGKQQTALLFGKTTRSDVRTRCLAVQEVKEFGQNPEFVAKKYHVVAATINTWIAKYGDHYKEYIESLPDGVVTIAKEEKLIYGDKNVFIIRQQLEENDLKLKDLMLSIKLNQTEENILEKLREKNQKRMEKLDRLRELAEEFNIEV